MQVFDSWVGALNAADYREFALPHTQKDLPTPSADASRRSTSASSTGAILHVMREAGGDVIGADWRIPLDAGVGAHRRTIAPFRAISIRRCCSVRASGCSPAPATSSPVPRGRPGHIFNLGHGILPIDAGRERAGARAIRPRTQCGVMREHDVVIIGAGIAGLAAAWELRQRGITPVVLERAIAPGA